MTQHNSNTIGRYDVTYKPTLQRTIGQFYNGIKGGVAHEQRVEEVALLNKMHKADVNALATRKKEWMSHPQQL